MIDKLLEHLPIISCQEATRLMSLAMEKRLSIKEWIELRLHLAVCELCKKFQRQINGLRQLLHLYNNNSAAPEAHLSDIAKEKLKTRLSN